jgi:hypothetical protein
MYSDLEGDDPLPGLREIFLENLLRRSARYARKRLGIHENRQAS